MNNEQNVNSEPQALDVDDAADAILGRWDDGETLSEVEEEDATSEDLAETEVDEDELDEAKLLWNSLIADLKKVLGSS